MDLQFITEHVFTLLKAEPGAGLVQSILLLLIWMNIRSLKIMLAKLEVNHDTRLGKLETRADKHDGRLMSLETHKTKG